MLGGGLIKRIIGEATRRLALLAIAVVILAVVFQLVCAAAIIALDLVLPLWAAVSLTAVAALVLAVVLLALALHTPEGISAPRDGAARPEQQALELGESMGEAMRRRPKTALGVALLAGLVLGADPSLRRDLLDLLRNPPR